jgi:hypothetical protein
VQDVREARPDRKAAGVMALDFQLRAPTPLSRLTGRMRNGWEVELVKDLAACPYCGAAKGRYCKVRGTGDDYGWYAHVERRINAAVRLNRAGDR